MPPPNAKSDVSSQSAPASGDGSPGGKTSRAAARARPARRYGLDPSDTLQGAAAKVVATNLKRLRKHARGVRARVGSDDVHDARVASRRIREALRVFGDQFDRRQTKPLRSELRRVGRRLGAVRDLDVLLASLETYVQDVEAVDPSEAAGLGPLDGAWRRERDRAVRRLAKELRSRRYRHLECDLDELARTTAAADGVSGGPAASKPTTPDPPVGVRAGAGSRILAAYEPVEAFDVDPATADVATLHRLRIAAKRLRYTIEAFEEVLDPSLASLREAVVALQDDAGKLHDAVVAAEKARAFAAGSPSRAGLERRDDGADAASNGDNDAVARFAASRDAEVGRLRRSIAASLPAVTGLDFRRALCAAAVTR